MKVNARQLLMLLIVLGVFLVLLLGVVLVREQLRLGNIQPTSYTLSSNAVPDTSLLTKSYTNRRFSFSINIPEGYSAQELLPDGNGAIPIVIQNEQGEGIQILVTPNAGDVRELTQAQIVDSIPDLSVDAVETIEIGEEYRGVAFLSDNEAFDRKSREVWFYFRGNLYQISTYARLDGLLKAIFSTWRFL